MITDPVSGFRAAMIEAGLPTPEMIIADGKLRRVYVEGDRPGSKNGWYILHGDSLPAGSFGSWRADISETWCARPERTLTEIERAEFKRRMDEARRQREIEEARVRSEARQKAQAIWDAAEPAPDNHPYLKKKGVKAHGLRLYKDNVVIPLYSADGTLHSLQFISAEGQKLFLTGGQKKGCYFSIGKPADTICIAEGYATAASVHEATGYPAVIAFDSGNMEPVARAIRGRFPDARLVIGADDDRFTEGNPGLTKARAAAEAVDGLLAVPDFPTDAAGKPTDFNDLHHISGLKAVKKCINAAKESAEIDEPVGASKETEGTLSGHSWPEPQPLPEGLPPVAAFDFALLPDTLKPWAQDICERVQCPPDFVAVAIMAGLGSIIGRKVGIRPQARTDWTVTPNQWAVAVGRPGVLKSPAMEAAMSPLKRLAAQATEAHKTEIEDYKRAVKLAKIKADEGEKAARKALAKSADADVAGLLDTEEPEPPAMRRYIANDPTAAALGELHRQNHNGLLVYRDELVSLLKSLDREDSAEARGFYLTGWNGDSPYTFDRISRGMNLHIPAVCLSLLGSTQPGRIAEYIRQAVRGGTGDDGLIQRFGLLVWPDTGGAWKDCDRWPDSEARRAAHQIYDRLNKLDPASIGAQQDTDHDGEPDGIPFLRFLQEAGCLFLEWRTDLEAKLRSGELHPAMESHLAKYRKLVPGLALVLHLAGGGTGPVGRKPTLQALAWAEYLETHARRAYTSVATPELSAAKAIIERLRKGDLPHTFSSWQVWRPGWAMLSDREQVADALRLLVDLNWLSITRQETGGRTATVYETNPRGLS